MPESIWKPLEESPPSGWKPVEEPDPGFLSGLKSTTTAAWKSGIVDPILHPATAVQKYAGPAGKLLEFMGSKLQDAWEAGRAGKPLEAIANLGEVNPLTGVLESVALPLAAGHPREAAGAALGLGATALVPAMARGSARAVAVGSRLPTAVAEAARAAAPDVALGAVKAGTGAAIGEALGEVPGLGHVARWVFAYPGAHQMATGVGKGASAFVASLRGKLAVMAGDDAALLDEIAKAPKSSGGIGKAFAKGTPEEQATIRRIADSVKGRQGPEVSPEAAGTPATPIPAPQPEPLPPSRQIEGRAPIITEPPEDVSGVRAVEPVRTVQRDPRTGRMMRVYLSGERAATLEPGALAEQEAIQKAFEPGARLSPGERIARDQVLEDKIEGFRVEKAERFAQVIHRVNQENPAAAITVEDLNAMTPEHLKKLAEAVGRMTRRKEGIPSPRTLAQIVSQLRKLGQ